MVQSLHCNLVGDQGASNGPEEQKATRKPALNIIGVGPVPNDNFIVRNCESKLYLKHAFHTFSCEDCSGYHAAACLGLSFVITHILLLPG
jgi:hypothetical protein